MRSGDPEARAEGVEERDFELGAGLGEAEHDVAGRASLSLTVPPETFRLVTMTRMSLSEALVLRGISVRSSTRRSSFLLAFRRLRSLSRVAYPARRLKMRSTRLDLAHQSANHPDEFGRTQAFKPFPV